jgi:hypothetical protein
MNFIGRIRSWFISRWSYCLTTFTVQLPVEVTIGSEIRVKTKHPVTLVTDDFGNTYVRRSRNKWVAQNQGCGTLVVMADQETRRPNSILVQEYR